MNIDNIIMALFELPLSTPNQSVYTRLKETGYFEIHNRISASGIKMVLNEHPNRAFIIKWWMQYSEDKRCSSGWYFLQDKDLQHTVGYMNEDGIMGLYEEKHKDALNACAAFIKHEVDEIKKHATL